MIRLIGAVILICALYYPLDTYAQVCTRDADCSDGVFCNGEEVCKPNSAYANNQGCVPGTPPCTEFQSCNESSEACQSGCPDNDGDGHESEECGGDDCDDSDRNRYPGNPEICDPLGIDEDCDKDTIGERDADGDGYIDYRCYYTDQ